MDEMGIHTGPDELPAAGLLAELFEACPEPVVVLDHSLTCVHANAAARGFAGGSELIGETPSSATSDPLTAVAWTSELEAVVAEGRQGRLEVVLGREDGRRRLELRAVPLGEASGLPGGVAVFGRDITAERHREEALRGQVTRDPLTGLLNLPTFHERVESALAEAQMSGESLAVVVADLDYLKVLNDTHGHRAGDEAIRAVASALAAVIRQEDDLARLGGDEFGWLVSGVGRDEVKRSAWRAVRAVSEVATVGDHNLSLSAGIAFHASASEPEQLFERADAALYDAKARGRGVVSIAGETEIGYDSRRRPGQTFDTPSPPDLTATRDLITTARAALREWVYVFAATGGCVDLLDPDGQTLEACAFYRFGHDDWELTGEKYALSDYPSTAAAIARRRAYACRVDDPDADPAEVALLRERGFAALMLIPLIAGEEVLGTVELFDARLRTFTADEARMAMALASHLAPLLQRLRA